MNYVNEDFGSILIGLAALFGLGSLGGLIAFQVYTFLADGVWHWFTLAELVKAFGHDPSGFIDPFAAWSWVGVGKIVNEIFYSAPAAGIAIVASCIIGLRHMGTHEPRRR
jgi:hypothetical protein